MKKNIKIFRTDSGKEPFLEWLNEIKSQNRKDYLRIRDRIERIATFGIFGDYKSVGEDVFELRFFIGPGYRIYFGKEENTTILLLWGGVKDTQIQDIQKAKDYWRSYHA